MQALLPIASPTAIVIARLGTAQTLAWASSYYLPAILAAPMARDLGIPVPTVFAAFSVALMVSAMVGPRAGAAIDRLGGRPVLMTTSLIFAAALVGLALASGPVSMFAAWMLMGIGMGCGLYESAFAALVRLYGQGARPAITGITLIAGFASTVGWPLSAWLEGQMGWRDTCLAWAALHLLIGLPLNAWLPRPAPAETERTDNPMPASPDPRSDTNLPATAGTASRTGNASGKAHATGMGPAPGNDHAYGARHANRSRRSVLLLSFVFAATWFVSTAMAAHLPRLMQAAGASLATAVLVGALIGPSQVAARLMEFFWLRRVHPLQSARLAAALHPLGVGLLLLGGPAFAPLFGVLHGAGNGILTISKGTLPLVLFGSQGYGALQGWLTMPARVAQALAPFLFGIVLDLGPTPALAVTAGCSLAALAALLLLKEKAAAAG